MQFKRSEIVAVFEGLGFATADKWNKERLMSRIASLPKAVSATDAIGDPDLDNLLDEIIGMVKDGEEIEVVNDSPGAKEKPKAKAENGKSAKMEVVSEKVGPAIEESFLPEEKLSPTKAKKVVEKQKVEVEPAKGRKTAKKSPKKAAKKTIKVADDLELETIVDEVSPVLLYDKSTCWCNVVAVGDLDDKSGFLLTAIPAALLCDISYVAARGISKESNAVQRLLSKRRIGEIKEYAERGGQFPSAVVLNWQNDDSLVLEEDDSFTIKQVPMSAQIIDGQHRVAGLRAAIELGDKSIGNLMIPVAIYTSLGAEDCANLFLAINTEQKTVPRNFVLELYGLASSHIVDAVTEQSRQLAMELMESSKSPMKGRLKGTVGKAKGIALASVVAALKPLVGDRGLFKTVGINTAEKQAKLLLAYFQALSEWYGSNWKDDDNALFSAAGFIGAIDFFRWNLLGYCVTNKINTAKAIFELIDTDVDLLVTPMLKGFGGKTQRAMVVDHFKHVFDLSEAE